MPPNELIQYLTLRTIDVRCPAPAVRMHPRALPVTVCEDLTLYGQVTDAMERSASILASQDVSAHTYVPALEAVKLCKFHKDGKGRQYSHDH